MRGLLVALPEVRLPGLGCWCTFRVPQILCLVPLRGCGWISGFWYSSTGVAPGVIPSSWHGFLPGARSVFVRWGSVEFLRTSDICVFLFWMHSSSWPRPRLGVFGIPCYVFSDSPSGSGDGLSFAFVPALVTMCSGTSLAPRFAGFTVPARPTRDNRNGRLFYPVRAVRCSWSAWAAPRQRCEPFLCPQFVTWGWDRRSLSPSGSGCHGHGGACSRSRNGLFCVPWARCTRAVAPYLLWKNLLSSWWMGVGVALELIFVRLLLRGCCPLVPRHLLPVMWVASRVLGCPVLLAWTYHCFRLGDWSSDHASSSVASRPSPSHGLARLGVHVCLHTFGMLSLLFPGNIGLHFLGISRSFFQ